MNKNSRVFKIVHFSFGAPFNVINIAPTNKTVLKHFTARQRKTYSSHREGLTHHMKRPKEFTPPWSKRFYDVSLTEATSGDGYTPRVDRTDSQISN